MEALPRRSVLVLVMAALLGGATGLRAEDPLASPESVGFSTDGLKVLRRTMRALVDEAKLAGVTTVVARHGKVVYLDAYGVQDLATKKPVTKDTIFRVASMTKPIVGVAMMMLWEQGKWTLDDPVAKHIPEFAGLKVATPNGEVPQARPMTMRQLMSHTAGFDVDAGYAKAGLEDSDYQAMINKLSRLPLITQPGTTWTYGPSVDIQGYIIEKLSGQTLDAFLRTKIFEPLGMKDTGFWVDAAKADRVTQIFNVRSGQANYDGAGVGKPHAETGVSIRQRRAPLHHRRLLPVRADVAARRRGQWQAAPESLNRGADADQRPRRRSCAQYFRRWPPAAPKAARPWIRARLRDRDGSGRRGDSYRQKHVLLGWLFPHLVLDLSDERCCRGGYGPEHGRRSADRRLASSFYRYPDSWCIRRWWIRRSKVGTGAADESVMLAEGSSFDSAFCHGRAAARGTLRTVPDDTP